MAVLKRRDIPFPEQPREGSVDTPSPLGVAIATAPLFKQGYAWSTEMDPNDSGVFFSDIRELPSGTLWLTNQPFDSSRPRSHLKNRFFLRQQTDALLLELGIAGKDPLSCARHLGAMTAPLRFGKEAVFLRDEPSLAAAAARSLPGLTSHSLWQTAAVEALVDFWQGTQKNAALSAGVLKLGRFDTTAQLVRCPMPDFSKPPKEIRGRFTSADIKHIFKDKMGFVRMSISNADPVIRDFLDMGRIVWTSNEALWLSERAEITATHMLITDAVVEHPAHTEGVFKTELSPFSWLDGLRAEAYYMAPSLKYNTPADAWLRANAHLASCFLAEYLVRKYGVTPNGLALNKIFIAFSDSERAEIRRHGLEAGFLFFENGL